VKTRDKYDRYLGDDLLNLAYAARALDVPATWATLADLSNLPRPNDPVANPDPWLADDSGREVRVAAAPDRGHPG
jgi:hypothetical protein